MKELYLNGWLFDGTEKELLEIEVFRNKFWYQNKRIHREDGPARIWSNGHQEWWQNGFLHRTDGPAVAVQTDEIKEWYIEGFTYYSFFNLFFPMRDYIKNKFPGE